MKINSIVSGVILLIAAGCAPHANETATQLDAPIPVKVITLERKMVHEPIYASGSFTTDDETLRSFKTGGVVQQVLVNEGDAVKEGQLLAILDLTEINAQVTQASLAYEKAQRDYNRVSNLYQDSVVTLEQFQNAGTGLEIAKEQLTTAKFNRTFSEIRASEDGFILRKFVNSGQVVSPGMPVFQTNGAGNGTWVLRVAVSDGQWNSLTKGDSAVITTDLPDLGDIPGFVSKKSEGVDPYTGTFSIDITPAVSIHRKVASGMFGKASVIPSIGNSVWAIPYDALLDGDGNKGYVFVTLDNRKAIKTPVSISGITRDKVLVDGGLENFTTLIVSGNAYLTDQSAISVIK